jgi:hypothetical protein
MEGSTVEKKVLILTGEAGELYAIPQDALEQYRVTDEQKAELEEQLGDDVSGYSMYQNFMTEQTAAYQRAELNQRGDEIRHKADYARAGRESEGDVEAASAGSAAQPMGVRRLFTGVLTTLRLAAVRVREES